MGYLLIDHRGGQDPDGAAGTLEEMDTATCAHCNKVIAIISRPTEKVVIDGVDLFFAHKNAANFGHEYKGKRHCRRCKKAICRACAASGVCGNLQERLERFREYLETVGK